MSLTLVTLVIFLFLSNPNVIKKVRGGTTTTTTTTKSSQPSDSRRILTYLQQEQVACSNAQQSIIQTLRQYKIPIGSEPGSLRKLKTGLSNTIHDRVVTSTEDNEIECRVTLDRVPVGSKCVAPCGCTGSQKWIQFSVFNKLRRKEPEQWKTCQTCKQPFLHDLFTPYGGTKVALLGYVLDHRPLFRSLALLVALFSSYVIGVQNWISRFLVSESFWQMVRCLLFNLFFLSLSFTFSSFLSLSISTVSTLG
jgi:hypothetical protein